MRCVEAAAACDVDGEGGRGCRSDDLACAAVSGEGRHFYRCLALSFHGYEPANEGAGGEGNSVCRYWCFGWGRGGEVRTVDYARGKSGGLAACEGDLSGDCGEGGGRCSVLRLGGRGWGRALCEDGA